MIHWFELKDRYWNAVKRDKLLLHVGFNSNKGSIKWLRQEAHDMVLRTHRRSKKRAALVLLSQDISLNKTGSLQWSLHQCAVCTMFANCARASAHHVHYHRRRENARTEPRLASAERELPAVSAARWSGGEHRGARAGTRHGRGATTLFALFRPQSLVSINSEPTNSPSKQYHYLTLWPRNELSYIWKAKPTSSNVFIYFRVAMQQHFVLVRNSCPKLMIIIF